MIYEDNIDPDVCISWKKGFNFRFPGDEVETWAEYHFSATKQGQLEVARGNICTLSLKKCCS